MNNSQQHWRALVLHIPVNGYADLWIAGRSWTRISADLMRLLPSECGLKGETLGGRTDTNGLPTELHGQFQYEDLAVAVHALRAISGRAGFPNRTRLTHVERFPDCTVKHHVLIRWVDGRMDPFSTELTDEVLLGPHNA
jgi:hypothetical protein